MKLNTIMIAFFMMLNGFGQDSTASFPINEEQCERNRSLYYQYLLQGMYKDARNFWLKAYAYCGRTPNLDEGFLTNGIGIYKKLREETFVNDSIRQQQVTDSIPWLYDQLLIIAPKPLNKLKYADFLLTTKNKGHSKISELFKAINDLKEDTPARYLSLYFRHLLLNVYNNASVEDKEILQLEILKTYFQLTDYANKALQKIKVNPGENVQSLRKSYTDAKAFMTKYIVQVTRDPQIIEKEMQLQFNDLPTDLLLKEERVNEHLELIRKFGRTEIPVYRKYTYALLELRPTYRGYAGIAEIENQEGNFEKAIEMIQKALELAETDAEKDEGNYRLAVAYYNTKQYKLAFNTAKKVRGEFKGKAMVLCGNSIAALANDCGESTFAREANYWLANDYYQRAIQLGENVSKSKFSNAWPTANDCFNEGVSIGDEYLLVCWGEKTIIRQ